MAEGSRFSLVVMTRDRPAKLWRCLETIAALSWEGDAPEVIVVDDGSEPPAFAVVEALAPRLAIACERLPGLGVAAARNRGLSRARRELVAFLADDYRLPGDYLERAAEFFRAHPEAQVVTFNIRPAGRGWLRGVQGLYLRLAFAQQLPAEVAPMGTVASFTLPASRAAVFRRALFAEVGGFDEALRVGEDGDLTRRLAARGIPVYMLFDRFVEHDEPLGLRACLGQRLRYGASFARVHADDPACALLARRGSAGVVLCAARKLRTWSSLAGRMRERARFLRLAPALFLFLATFYLGALRELGSARPRAEDPA
jgi:mycofactocin glycosyltransferase